jgi:hypothetical protein
MNDITVSAWFMSGMICNYVGMVYLLTNFMKTRRELRLKGPIQIYNICQVVFNAYIVYGLYDSFPITNFYGINIAYNDKIRYYVSLHYLSKYIDYIDTVFMILRKKNSQVSFLHVYHHASVILPWGWVVAGGHGNGTSGFGALINAFIHALMYSHYLYTSLGYRNPFKRFLTQAQIAQFFLCVGHSVAVILYERNVPSKYAYGELMSHIVFIYLFGKFYLSSYT